VLFIQKLSVFTVACRQLNITGTGRPFAIRAKPIKEKKVDPIIQINHCKGDEESIMDCAHYGFGIADPNCDSVFLDCNPTVQPPPFIATSDILKSRFRIAVIKLQACDCSVFCEEYGGNIAVLDTEEKFKTVYKMIQKTSK
jgi:hypothetical protein